MERNKRIKEWLGDKHNLIFVGILIVALVIRLYYFSVTYDQPLWWDEAEYMLKAKNIALGTPETGWAAQLRPIFFPFLSSFFFKLGLGIVPLRFFFVLLSLAGITLLYLLGGYLVNKRVGLFAASLLTVFYIDIFYTTRLLVDVPQIFFVILAAFLFTLYFFGNSSKKVVWAILPVIFIGAQTRFTVGIFALILLVFLLMTKGLKLFKEKDWYISTAIAVLTFVPYLIYMWVKFSNPFYTISQGLTTSNASRAEGVSPFDIFMEYIRYLPNYTHLIFFIAAVLGFIGLVAYFLLTIDKTRSNTKPQKYLFLLLWIVIPLLYFGFFVNHFEDRYLFMSFPAIFIVAGIFFDKAYEFLSKYHKVLAVVVIAAVLVYGGVKSIERTDDLIKSKIPSYKGLQDAGLWIKANSLPTDTTVSAGMPQLTYYSERATYAYPLNESDLLAFAKEKNAKFMTLSIWERSPEWTYDWPERNQDKVKTEAAFYVDEAKTQVSVVVYSFNDYPYDQS